MYLPIRLKIKWPGDAGNSLRTGQSNILYGSMYNISQLLFTLLPLCNYREIENNGLWVFPKSLPHKVAAWDSCPETQLQIRNQRQSSDDRSKFSCQGQIIKSAYYKTDGCDMLSLEQSSKAIAHSNKKLVYVGDSLIRQLHTAALCSGEDCQSLNRTQMKLITDLFLRSDIPCDPRCAVDKEFRKQRKFLHPCWACRRDGIKKDFKGNLVDPTAWHRKLPKEDTLGLVINSGAWYNSFKGVMNSTATYAETLHTVGPILQNLREMRNIEVFWVGLPPHIFDLTTTNSSTYGYEWIYYGEKDKVAKDILSPYGVTFVNTDVLTKPRKLRDPFIAADGIHWW